MSSHFCGMFPMHYVYIYYRGCPLTFYVADLSHPLSQSLLILLAFLHHSNHLHGNHLMEGSQCLSCTVHHHLRLLWDHILTLYLDEFLLLCFFMIRKSLLIWLIIGAGSLHDLWSIQYVQSYTNRPQCRLILLLWVWNCSNVRPKEISTYDLPEFFAICILQTSSLFFADSQSLLSLLFFSNKALQLLHSPCYKRQQIHSWISPFVCFTTRESDISIWVYKSFHDHWNLPWYKVTRYCMQYDTSLFQSPKHSPLFFLLRLKVRVPHQLKFLPQMLSINVDII
jgi:hypothetical protein